jgi:uncharacterized membrane protein YesL
LSLPIVTCGPATSALYYTIVKSFLQGDRDTFHIFWKAFKDNLKPGIILTLIILPFALILAYFYYVLQLNWSTNIGAVMFVAYDLMLVVPIGMLCWLFPMQARFVLPRKQMIKNSFFLAMKHLFTTIVLVLLTVELIISTLEYWWPIFFTPMVWAFISALFLEKKFKLYLSESDQQKFDRQPPVI